MTSRSVRLVGPNLATSIALAVSRRRFVSTAGKAVFGATLTTVMLGTRFGDVARAYGSCNSPCGPSALCPASNCSGNCKTSHPSVDRRPYGGTYCSTTYVNKWVEDYGDSSGCNYAGAFVTCYDCCGSSGTTTCTSCTEVQKTCICRRIVY